ncbi:MAG TPA: tyrosine-type recombinase/integrase [Gemmataceae bacterium]|nr:tyrosine-type recombinase/integrase [Gemmataceae bacterium]
MSDTDSTSPVRSGKSAKPNKPYPDFPLFPHAAGVWAKKIRGKLHYFGKWDDPDAALDSYMKQKEDLHAGRTPRPDADAMTVKDVANAFLNHKQALLDAGELSPRTWTEYKATTDLLITRLGKSRLVDDLRPDDFAALRKHMAAKWGAHRLAKIIQYVRSVFKYAYDAEMIDRPLRFGPGFQRPAKKVMRIHRAEQGQKLFTAEEVRQLLTEAGPTMRAMILLGINCGFGNSDCGNLPLSALDLETGWIDYPRPKTGVGRRCPLWPETEAAIREALAKRPAPKSEEDAGLVFITKYGLGWSKDTSTNPVSQEMGKLLRKLDINGRKRLGFYALRHSFRTIADEAKDQPAVDHIMGHESTHMSSVYRESISDERLKAVTEHVRAWLFTLADARTTPEPI